MTPGVTLDPIPFWARVRPERVALRAKGETVTYGRLEESVSRAAEAFAEEGLDSGQHISVELDATHGLHFAITLHALHRLGLLPVLIGGRLTEPERAELRTRAQVDFALTTTPERVAEATLPHRGPTSRPAPRERRLDSPAAICFTSGTEGKPRAVVLTHDNFLWSALASGRNLGVQANDLWLACLPLHHVGGLSVLTRSAYYGTGVLLHERFDPDAVNAAIDREGVTLLSLVPPMLARVLQARGERPFPQSLRAALIGGGPAPVDLLRHAARLGLRALPTYGLTEATSQVATLSPRVWPDALHTCGRPLPFVRVEVRGPDGSALGPREEGEIAVRGPTVSEGYFDGREDRRPPGHGKWHMTGDFGAWDENGRLVLLDRRTDRVSVGGESVSPAEVEQVLGQHPAVAEVCVVGVPAGAWGHEIVAAVTFNPGFRATLEELRGYAGQCLAPFKLPRRLLVAASLPRNAAGKILRSEIRGWFLNQMAAEDSA